MVAEPSMTGHLCAQRFGQIGLGNSEESGIPAGSTSPPGGNLVDGSPPAASQQIRFADANRPPNATPGRPPALNAAACVVAIVKF